MLRTRNGLAAALFGLLAIPGTGAPLAAQTVERTLHPDSLLAHVEYLASDALGGREAGTPGADSAVAYLARRFEAFGLRPGTREGYRQPFEVAVGLAVDSTSRLVLRGPRGELELRLGRDWMPFEFSGAGQLEGPVIDLGHGLEPERLEAAIAHGGAGAPTGGGDPGPIALIRGGLPDGTEAHGAGPHGTGPRFKATAAREHGAKAVLVTVARLDRPGLGEPPRPIGIPAVQLLETERVRDWLEANADRSVTLDVRAEPMRATTANVVGRLAGRDPALSDEWIVVGAHHDHLGMGGPGSLAPDTRAVHNGADDNASGTALLLELARYFAGHPEARPARGLVFVAFGAEEMGLLGSDHFVDRPPVPLDRVAAMINFDMVGRLRDDGLQVFGTETAEEFDAILDSLEAAGPLGLSRSGDGYGPSDQTSFYARGIPVLHLFTGTHSEYHRPEDDTELINAAGMAKVGDLAIGLIRALGDRRAPLSLVEQERPQTGTGGGYGPYLGTIPDFGEVEGGGVRLTGVRPGSPAERAGIRGGDVVIEFDGREILNLYDYTYALRDHAPGDTVVIRVRRDGQAVEVTAVLERRR